HRSAERISNERARTIWQSRREFRLLIEPVVRRSRRSAVVLVESAVELICAALGDNRNLRAGASARIRVRIGGGYAKLLHRIEGGTKYGGEGKAVFLIVVVNPVQGYVGLIGPRPGDCAASTIDRLVNLPAQIQHARLQAKKVRNISA